MISGAAALLQIAIAASVVSSSEVRYFPGSYFDTTARVKLQKKAMDCWPGPSGLRRLWESGELDEDDRVALLLGAAAHHDPELLSIYAEAVRSDSPRVRQAAAYGYHDLLADRLPDLSGGVDSTAADRLAAEMTAVRWTLRRRPLVAMWLHAALVSEGSGLPDYRGIAPSRSAIDCFRAVERLMEPEDLELLVDVYEMSGQQSSRISLLRLIEGLTLSRFLERPTGDRQAWGSEIYQRALTALDATIVRWRGSRCRVSFRRVVSSNLERLGARGVDPLDPDACTVWGLILLQGDPEWWATAARRLYECGAPWTELSVLQATSAENNERRDQLVGWLRLRDRPRPPRGARDGP